MWMKVDDRLHAHRKTRAVLRSAPRKLRDAAPMGLWVLTGSWAAQNGTDGWAPVDELERFDDDWEALVRRLVAADYWWPEKRDGEDGYGFVDWSEWNTSKDRQSADGRFGNHERWHVRRKLVKPGCEFCPDDPGSEGESGGDSGAISGADRGGESEFIALPDPNPTRTRPDPDPTTSSDSSDITPDRFDEFWDTYGHKVGRKKCEVAYRNALKKPGVDATLLIAAAATYAQWCAETDTYIKNPLTWLHGEHWRDERPARQQPMTNLQRHMQLVQQLGDETLPQIEEGR